MEWERNGEGGRKKGAHKDGVNTGRQRKEKCGDSGEKTDAFSVYNREYLNRQLWCTFPFLWFKKKGRRKAFDLGERTKERPFVNIFIPPLHSGKIAENNLT